MIEEWRVVPGWDYEVSNFGRVRSIARLGVSGRQTRRIYGGNILRPVLKKKTGYLCVSLKSSGKKTRQVSVHRMVLEAFCGPAIHGEQACHRNGVRTGNAIENLYWGTAAQNQADKVRHGNSLRGEKNKRAKLTEDQVRHILGSEESQPALARRYGVSQVLISKIRLRKVWQHVL